MLVLIIEIQITKILNESLYNEVQIVDDMKFDLIITLTYVLIDNFRPCFFFPSETKQGLKE